jgi:hypothetical protein
MLIRDRAHNENIRPGLFKLGNPLGINRTFDFDGEPATRSHPFFRRRPQPIDRVGQTGSRLISSGGVVPDAGIRRLGCRQRTLISEQDDEKIQLCKNGADDLNRHCRIQNHARLAASGADLTQHGEKSWGRFRVDGNPASPRPRKILHKPLRPLNEKMHFELQTTGSGNALNHWLAHRQARRKMAVTDVNVNRLYPRLPDQLQLVAEPREIKGQQRGNNQRHRESLAPGVLPNPALRLPQLGALWYPHEGASPTDEVYEDLLRNEAY